eukprot:NODE_6177_length_1698_cov_3.957352.p1 GENE.NODE_6177_length_1698_cov_3.957352~~NODE_6177_length_1698_cov_3.957352.p1  ORF type:complete len:365 (+),score=76.43 NODE_6177_length_1698_cov_3.957352:208-1302(+)
MDEDLCSPGWARKAVSRWAAYTALWGLTFSIGLISAFHSILKVAGALLGLLLATSLVALFITLFERTHARRSSRDLPLLLLPWFGALVLGLGTFSLLEASRLVLASFSSISVQSASALCERYAGLQVALQDEPHTARLAGFLDISPVDLLPRTVCIEHAYVKTDWEAAKLFCNSSSGHVTCLPEYVVAPVFDDKPRADIGHPEDIFAWAVSHGHHVDVDYRSDGQLCGYLSGRHDFDIYVSDYRLAVEQVIRMHGLALNESIPLEKRPLIMTLDPLGAMRFDQAWLCAAVFFLGLCPCTGPLPVGAILIYFCWRRREPNVGPRRFHSPPCDGGNDEEIGAQTEPYMLVLPREEDANDRWMPTSR